MEIWISVVIEAWEEEIEEMDSHESFMIMVDFAEIIDNLGDYRQEWVDFKKMRYKVTETTNKIY